VSAIYDWATPDNLQPEPVTVEIWRNLPEEYCRQVEIVNGQVVRCAAPTRTHQNAARRLTNMLEAAAEEHMAAHPGECLDVTSDVDITLWEIPSVTIRRPDAMLHDCAPPDERPLPASAVKVVIEIMSPGSDKADRVDKLGEYASAGIPFYWLVWLTGTAVASVDIHVLDHVLGGYRKYRTITPADETSVIDIPVSITIDWSRLTGLVR
jgi:Uma2 family endonuclease